MTRLCASLALLAIAVCSTANAAGVSDARVGEIVRIALGNIEKALCENNRPCQPASAAEKQRPPIATGEARGVMARAVTSAEASWCGLDWQHRSYLPMMRGAVRARRTERQMALIGLIHGIVMGDALAVIKKEGNCPATRKADVEKRLTAIR